ncbi:hypothetical protein RND71_040222 [Anisodus tanguticus]|uniref:Jacalin-type lectin domain-containing protein n=1 Tax=Anisodus tanguticus TaxID=243964 RepID=A0AAE1QYA7_9SOLA|nr:hypothetical protein RND71_040222 [Anisodus tanguticus]
MLVEAWGGRNGSEWNYKLTNPVKEIIIAHGGIIDSIIFRTLDQQGTIDSPKFGGRGGDKKTKVTIENAPREYLTGIKGTLGYFVGHLVVKSLCFTTNLKSYGPIGTEAGGCPFSLLSKGGAIVGFHGHSGAYLDAIGVYLQHVAPLPQAKQIKPLKEPKVEEINDEFPNQMDVMKYIQPRSPGPWGGYNGKGWDDGVFCNIKQVHVHMNTIIAAVSGIQIEYEKKNKIRKGNLFTFGGFDMQINIDGKSEFLMGIEGFYSPMEDAGGVEVVRQITVYTNKAKYGPYGIEIGTYFNPSAARGKIVGFYGRSGMYLNAIGVHMEYFS